MMGSRAPNASACYYISPMGFEFPDPERAGADGLLAIGGDLSPETLLAAYTSGIFPWFNEGDPILWWSPDPRMVLFPDEFHASRRLARRMRQGRFRITHNAAFTDVMRGCAAPRQWESGTWITEEMIQAYVRLFDLGHAQSIEVWMGDDLAGGSYGVQIGRAFFAESMFSRETDASKVALAHLVQQARREGWLFIDCQFHTAHLASLGAREIPRREYLKLLAEACQPQPEPADR